MNLESDATVLSHGTEQTRAEASKMQNVKTMPLVMITEQCVMKAKATDLQTPASLYILN